MPNTVYYCRCATCRRERTVESYESAHEFFDDHAERGHEVEIVQADGEPSVPSAE